jgi:hypothetical protein
VNLLPAIPNEMPAYRAGRPGPEEISLIAAEPLVAGGLLGCLWTVRHDDGTIETVGTLIPRDGTPGSTRHRLAPCRCDSCDHGVAMPERDDPRVLRQQRAVVAELEEIALNIIDEMD